MSDSLFRLPDVGEGLTEAEIVSWRVAAGDSIEINQVIVEIETAKSLVELPSPFEGVVGEIMVVEGSTVEVGTPIIRVTAFGASGTEAEAAAGATQLVAEALPVVVNEPEPEQAAGAVLVGYGTKGHVSSRRKGRVVRPAVSAGGAPVPVGTASSGADLGAGGVVVATAGPGAAALTGLPVIAKPPIRKLAKDLDVALTEVTPTGPIGDITRDDVIRHASQAKVFHNIETPQWADEREERIPVKGVRKQIARAMVQSAFTAPHVSLFVDVDATRTMEFVKRLRTSADFAGVKVSPLLIMAKAIMWAVRRNPMVNSAWTDKEIIVRNYVNLGVAAATPRGLLVPNVKEAQSMTLLELATALEHLTLTAREGRTSPADMADGTITITNIGVFGMDTGTPILNPGEVAIVALGTIKQRPWVVDGEVRPRFVTTLGASFDHRVVDGDVASRFLADVAAIVEEPALLLD